MTDFGIVWYILVQTYPKNCVWFGLAPHLGLLVQILSPTPHPLGDAVVAPALLKKEPSRGTSTSVFSRGMLKENDLVNKNPEIDLLELKLMKLMQI